MIDARAGGFGERMRAARLAKGLSQLELTGVVELSKSYISLLESGQRQPSPRVVAAMAAALDVLPEDLVPPATDPGTLDETRAALRASEYDLHTGNPHGAKTKLRQLVTQQLDPETNLRARRALALALERTGQLQEAVGVLEELVNEAERQPRTLPWLQLTSDLARCYKEAGDLHRATEVAEAGVARARALGLTTDDFPRLVVSLAGAVRERGDTTYASHLLTTLLADLGPTGSARDKGSALWNASVIAAERGEYGDGVLLAERALALMSEEEDVRAAGVIRTTLAWMLLDAGGYQHRALELLGEARERLVSAGLQVDAAYAETELSRAYLSLGQTSRAIDWARLSLEHLGADAGLEAARARLALAAALTKQGDSDEGLLAAAVAAEYLETVGAGRQAAAAWRELARLFIDHGRHEEAVAAYERGMKAVGLPESAVSSRGGSSHDEFTLISRPIVESM